VRLSVESQHMSVSSGASVSTIAMSMLIEFVSEMSVAGCRCSGSGRADRRAQRNDHPPPSESRCIDCFHRSDRTHARRERVAHYDPSQPSAPTALLQVTSCDSGGTGTAARRPLCFSFPRCHIGRVGMGLAAHTLPSSSARSYSPRTPPPPSPLPLGRRGGPIGLMDRLGGSLQPAPRPLQRLATTNTLQRDDETKNK